MIYKNNKRALLIFYREKPVIAVYAGSRLVWQSSRSCFGSGGWNNDLPWDNDDGWKN